MDSVLKVMENQVQIGALAALVSMYVVRVFWLVSLPVGKEKARPRNSPARGILLSFGSMLTPWFAIGTRKQALIYAEFALFHVAVAIAIALTFVHPYAPQLLIAPAKWTLVALLGFGLLSGVLRLIRRIVRPEVRLVSTPDDYFSISLLSVFLALAILTLVANNAWTLISFFVVTTFFLLYVPWSKISHYLYILFTQFFFGFYFGRRGVIARKRALEV